jgi:hypothetical protein
VNNTSSCRKIIKEFGNQVTFVLKFSLSEMHENAHEAAKLQQKRLQFKKILGDAQ